MPVTNRSAGGQAGDVKFFAGSDAPAGWLKANGATISRTAYAALFAAIGTTYGAGDGATTFKLPDYRGEFIRGADDGRGVDAGRVVGSAQADEMKAHGHRLRYAYGTGQAYGVQGYSTDAGYLEKTAQMEVPFIEPTGGNETRPRNVAALACIKY